ncbi:MAG: dihydropteroate synthase [Longimicrobiales bacterium]|nr:dihydropteroate synthase [Longimicrobiales bacterium]
MRPTGGHPGLDAGIGTQEAPGPRVFSEWSIAGGALDLTTPAVMGILNLTPDSFSDGGLFSSLEESLHRARRLLEEGARILDVGGESTRPGAEPVSEEEEIRRVLPFIKKASAAGLGPLSIDTRHAAVAREALRAGAQIVNDVSGLRHDPGMAGVVAGEGAGLVLSHMRGTPATMRELAEYGDVASEVARELETSLSLALDAGVSKERIVVDPGIGFAKTAGQSLALLRDLASLRVLGYPIQVGPSRKSFIGEVTGLPPEERLPGTLAACVLAYLRGASVFRVHDVAPVVQALSVTQAIEGTSPPRGVRWRGGGSGAPQARIQRA